MTNDEVEDGAARGKTNVQLILADLIARLARAQFDITGDFAHEAEFAIVDTAHGAFWHDRIEEPHAVLAAVREVLLADEKHGAAFLETYAAMKSREMGEDADDAFPNA